MKYKHWTKIDDGAEGAWAVDTWLRTLEIIYKHEGEEVYDPDSKIYEELEKEIPDLSWRSYEGESFRPYFRDFSKPWTLTSVASFDGQFKVLSLGVDLLKNKINEIDFWILFLSSYIEGGESPFVDISNAFLKTNVPVTLEKIYWCIVRNYRMHKDSFLDLTIDSSEPIPSVARRRLMLMLQLMERTGGLLRIGSGAKQRWIKWDIKALNKIIGTTAVKHQEITWSGESCFLSKPFLLLAGISGTGKTRFVREQAKATGSLAETYCLTPVRPDWHEPSDLLGYISRLSGEAEYIATDVLRFLAKAWRAKLNADLSIDTDVTDEGHGEYLNVSGSAEELSAIPPYWLCLDEMNLAPVEQYFSDYLSILETCEWRWDGERFKYFSDPLLKAATLQQLEESGREKLRKDLGFEGEEYDRLWSLICEHGMGIPFNLIVAGTVNMDETTHGFSRKVIDRALSFDFGEFFPNDFDAFYKPKTSNKNLTYPIYSHANKAQGRLPEKSDPKGLKSIAFLSNVNRILKGTPFELAYRALNELLLAVICEQPAEESELQAVWDDFLMCKVLPRIEGDADKLGDAPSILERLKKLLEREFSEIWNSELDEHGRFKYPARSDLYRQNIVADEAKENEKVIRIACRSKSKIQWMQKRLVSPGFTSFWP